MSFQTMPSAHTDLYRRARRAQAKLWERLVDTVNAARERTWNPGGIDPGITWEEVLEDLDFGR